MEGYVSILGFLLTVMSPSVFSKDSAFSLLRVGIPNSARTVHTSDSDEVSERGLFPGRPGRDCFVSSVTAQVPFARAINPH